MSASYRSSDVAALFQKSSDWFHEHKRALLAAGFPAPLPGPGHPRWSRAQVDAWFDGKLTMLRRAANDAANDAAPLPAPELRQWQRYLHKVLAS